MDGGLGLVTISTAGGLVVLILANVVGLVNERGGRRVHNATRVASRSRLLRELDRHR